MGCGPSVCHFVTLEADGPFRSAAMDGSASDALTTRMRVSNRAACNLDGWHKAEADFATWLVMAKLGGFDDLPSNAQSFLTNYRTDPRRWSSPSHGRSRGLQRYYRGAGTKDPTEGEVLPTDGLTLSPVYGRRVLTWLRHRRDERLWSTAAPRAGACNAARLSTMA